MLIETDRLHLIPLTARQLKLWIDNLPALEKELDCTYLAEPMEDFFLKIVKGQIEITEKDEGNYLFHSFWFIVRKSDRIVVGSADFKDVPNENGEVEIGYGLGKAFEHNGYMTETVKAMCSWVLVQKGVSSVIAETETNNQPSENVLKRCGFVKYREMEVVRWRL